MKTKILVVEDEEAIARSVEYALGREGFDAKSVGSGQGGLEQFRQWHPDLVILDLILPDMDGLDVCRAVRKESAVPLIMLTAKTAEIDRVLGLELGADDYVTKPFSMRELIARVKGILRRAQGHPEEPDLLITFDNLTIDHERREVKLDGTPLQLTLKEYEVLRELARNRGKVVTREALFDRVWNEEMDPAARTLDVHIHWLREKIEKDVSHPCRIVTVRGVGYKFEG